MRNSFWISLFIFLLPGCISFKPLNLTKEVPESVHPGEIQPNLFTNNGDQTSEAIALFKATLDIREHHLTGLLLIKEMADTGYQTKSFRESSSKVLYRIIFTNEIGMTFFDFELSDDAFRPLFCFGPLQKKALLRIFETDFRLLLTTHPVVNLCDWYQQEDSGRIVCNYHTGKYNIWRSYETGTDALISIIGKSNLFDRTEILFGYGNGGNPRNMVIENPVIRMKLSLKLLIL